ncbi:hypothetical protein PF003_g9625 [Phytophthora fragariae]|nr:hypothetical protein PF003_g9625 [Phytophthora fragariae]
MVSSNGILSPPLRLPSTLTFTVLRLWARAKKEFAETGSFVAPLLKRRK